MKDFFAKSLFLLFDVLAIVLSIVLAFYLRNSLGFFQTVHTIPLENYLTFWPIYIVTLTLLAYEGVYTKRYDFWHETQLVLKGILFSVLVVLAYLALSKSIQNYSRIVILMSFLFMVLYIPFFKYFLKRLLWRLNIWKTPVKVYADDPFLRDEISQNPYLGYVKASEGEPHSVFINSTNFEPRELQRIIEKELQNNHEVNFIPLINRFDLTHSHIYSLFNTRTNLIVFQNRLKSRLRQVLQSIFNYTLAMLLLPILLPIIGILAFLIKRESSGPVFFTHIRIGKDGKKIPTLKFRSMYSDAKERLEALLESDPEIRKEWETNFKLKNDPRVTRTGAFLRKTSLDELPQIFNVLRGEMNFVGPRPVIREEIERYYKEDAEYYYMVKPGITGLWQVSGRSDTDYDFRVATDKWYVSNWSLWLDIVILFKTIKVVLKREGAY